MRGLSFGVKKGEIFALLGVNGAGKSSTFKCLSAGETISGGSIKLLGQDVNEFYDKPWKLDTIVGYCPQYDCLEPNLTVHQTLTLVAEITGVHERYVHKVGPRANLSCKTQIS